MKTRIYFCVLVTTLLSLSLSSGDLQDQDLNFLFRDSTPMLAKMERGHFRLPVKINGSNETYYFVVDTGAQVSMIDSSVAAKLRLGGVDPLDINGVGSNAARSNMTDSLTLDTPDVSITGARMAISSALHGQGFAGLFGFDLIKHCVMKLDYINKTVTLFDPLRFTDTRQIQIPLALGGGSPRIEITLVKDGVPYTTPTVLDSGAMGGIILTQDFQKDNRSFHLENLSTFQITGVGGTDIAHQGTVPELHLGDQVLKDQPVQFMDNYAGSCGLLGAQVLSQYDVTFDAPDSLLLLRPNGRNGQSPPISTDPPPGDPGPDVAAASAPSDSQPQTVQGTGFTVKEVNGSFLVTSVSVVHSGIHVGDMITQIDKTPTSGMDMTQFGKLLQRPIRRITVNRDGSEMQMRMLIAAPLPTDTNQAP